MPGNPWYGTRGELAGAVLWSVQPVAVAIAAAGVPPLLQATLTTSASLLLVWLWTRWRDVAVFAQDATLAPGVRLGLLYSARLALLYLAAARLGAAGAVECMVAVLLLLPAAARRGAARPFAAVPAALALLVVAPLLDPWGLLLAASAALAWAGLEWAVRDVRLAECGGEKLVFYQLIGAAVTLPVVSVVAGENWLVDASSTAWWALAAQVGACVLASALLWIAPDAAHRGQRLPALLAVAPSATLLLQAASANWPTPPYWVAAALLLAAARWPPRAQLLSADAE
jgi:hypothetical protein